MNLQNQIKQRPIVAWIAAALVLAVGCGVFVWVELDGKRAVPARKRSDLESLPDGVYFGGPRAREAAGY